MSNLADAVKEVMDQQAQRIGEQRQRIRELTFEAVFLLERLEDFDNNSLNKTEEGEGNWHGHVAPSIARLTKLVELDARKEDAAVGGMK